MAAPRSTHGWGGVLAAVAGKREERNAEMRSRGAAIGWRPQGDSNPRSRRERAVSWAGLDDGDPVPGEPRWDRTNDPLLKRQMLYH